MTKVSKNPEVEGVYNVNTTTYENGKEVAAVNSTANSEEEIESTVNENTKEAMKEHKKRKPKKSNGNQVMAGPDGQGDFRPGGDIITIIFDIGGMLGQKKSILPKNAIVHTYASEQAFNANLRADIRKSL